jgi:hypothetical protein
MNTIGAFDTSVVFGGNIAGRIGNNVEVGTMVYIVVRFDPSQCGACGNGKLDKVFGTLAEAEAYVKFKASGRRHGASWEIKDLQVESYPVEGKNSL